MTKTRKIVRTIGEYLEASKDLDAGGIAAALRADFKELYHLDLTSPCGIECKTVINATLAYVAMLDKAGQAVMDEDDRWGIWYRAMQAMKVFLYG